VWCLVVSPVRAPPASPVATPNRVERILFAADFPHEDDAEAVRFMDGAGVTEGERRQIYQTNARRVFKLKA
jgi:predicted TIM-barrel fold metal-dependent hydrolase